MSCFMPNVLLVLIPSLLGISNKFIFLSKHLSSFAIIISAVPESFLSISRNCGVICRMYVICIHHIIGREGLYQIRVAEKWHLNRQEKCREKNSVTCHIFLVHSPLQRKDRNCAVTESFFRFICKKKLEVAEKRKLKFSLHEFILQPIYVRYSHSYERGAPVRQR